MKKSTVLITGGSKGIGRKIAERFAYSGYNVVINYNRSNEEANALYKELSDKGYAPKFYGVTDLGNGVYGIVAKQIFPSILIKNHLKMQNHVRYATVESLLEARKASDEVKRKWAKRMREMALYLDRQKIRGLDLQYLLVPNGDVFMIDFGNFYRAEVKDLYRQTVTDTEDMIESFESEGPIS